MLKRKEAECVEIRAGVFEFYKMDPTRDPNLENYPDRRVSDKLGTKQSRIAFPLRKDDTAQIEEEWNQSVALALERGASLFGMVTPVGAFVGIFSNAPPPPPESED